MIHSAVCCFGHRIPIDYSNIQQSAHGLVWQLLSKGQHNPGMDR